MHLYTTLMIIFALLALTGVGNSTSNNFESILADIKSRLEAASQGLETAKENLPSDFDDLCKNSCKCPECKEKIRDAKPADCSDIYLDGERRDGLYDIWPQNRLYKGPIRVYCDMESNGGGWTVVQRRDNYGNPEDYFYQDWNAYKTGFGNMHKDFWIGNENLFALTNQRPYQLRVNLSDWEENSAYAIYDEFWVEDERRNYTLHVKGYSGTAGDSLRRPNGRGFFTKDRDNKYKCAAKRQGAWWYGYCAESNLNGLYKNGETNSMNHVYWHTFRGLNYSLKSTVMKIRPANYKPKQFR